MPGTRNSASLRSFNGLVVAAAVLALWSAAAVLWFHRHGYTLYYGDAEAHLNIARRVTDSRTPGAEQLGTVWLPLPHVLTAVLARSDKLWQSGLAGALPSACGFAALGVFLFLAARDLLGSTAAGAAAAGVIATNPNVMYLQATPMNEPLLYGSLAAVLFATVRLRQSPSLPWAVAAGVSLCAGTLVRYEAWFLVPFVCLYVLIRGGARRWTLALVAAALASLGPAAWLAHNRWYYGNALEFFNGPYAPRAIQAGLEYPGKGNWGQAWLYYRSAAALCLGQPLIWAAAAGAVVLLLRRTIWPLVLLLAPVAFYVWSVHSSETPVRVPNLWPNDYYNTRYGLVAILAAAFASAALVTLAPPRWRILVAAVVPVMAAAPLASQERWITWKESQVNSASRRAWTRQAADFLRAHYRKDAGIFMSFGDMTGICREAGIPLRETLTGDNGVQWLAAVARPDLFLREEWAIATGGDAVQSAILKARRRGPYYSLVKKIMVKGAPVFEIYRRGHYAEAE